MTEKLIHGKTLPQAYHAALVALQNEGDIISCDDWAQKQKEISMNFVVTEPLTEPMVSKLFIGGHKELQQYVLEVLDGILDFKIGDGWEYTYHNRMTDFHAVDKNGLPHTINQFAFVLEELKRRPDSRRAIINIRDNGYDPFVDSPACLQAMQFFIRDGKLHQKVFMRSNDAPKASFMNAFAFIMLQKRLAETLGVGMGTYSHRANSYHAYEKDFPMLENYVAAITTSAEEGITYDYEDFYKELMEETIPEINELVETLKVRSADRKNLSRRSD